MISFSLSNLRDNTNRGSLFILFIIISKTWEERMFVNIKQFGFFHGFNFALSDFNVPFFSKELFFLNDYSYSP